MVRYPFICEMPVQPSYTFLCCVKYKHCFQKQCLYICTLVSVNKSLKEVIKCTWVQVDPRAESRLLTLSFLECPCDLPFLHQSYFSHEQVRYCETTWIECVTEPRVKALETLRFRWVSVEVYSLNTQAKPCMSISLLTKTATCQSGVACLFPRLLHALRVLGPVSGLTWETLKIVSQHKHLFTRWCLVFKLQATLFS